MSNNKNIYDPNLDPEYRQAMADREALLSQKPIWQDAYRDQTQSLYQAIQDRESFSYDPEKDPLYRQYRQRQLRAGRLAMEDTLGKAAGLTGGYASSYAQTAGQQTYGEYLHRLSEAMPEFYAQSQAAYDAGTEDLYRRYELALDQSQQSYDRYRDSLSDYLRQLDALEKRANNAYDRGYTQWYNALKLEQDAQKLAMTRQNTAYDRLAELISMGYQPTARELAAAGMTAEQMQAMLAWSSIDETMADAAMSAAVAGGTAWNANRVERGNVIDQKLERYRELLESVFRIF